MDSPSPAPAVGVRRRRIGSKGALTTSAGIPAPSSWTLTAIPLGPAAAAMMLTRVPGGLWPSALSSRFTKTCSRRSWSAHTTGREGSQLTLTMAAPAGGRHATAASRTKGMSHQSRCSRRTPDSIAEKSSKSPTRRPSRADSAAIRCRKRCCESPSQVTSGCIRLEAYPLIAVSGVRSSWLSRERNPRCSSCDLRSAAASWCAIPASSRSSASRSEWAASSISVVASAVCGPPRQPARSTVGPAGAANVTASSCWPTPWSGLATSSRRGLASSWSATSSSATGAPALFPPAAVTNARQFGPPGSRVSSAAWSACSPLRSACRAISSPLATGMGPAKVSSISLIVSSTRLRAVTSSSNRSRSIALAAYPA